MADLAGTAPHFPILGKRRQNGTCVSIRRMADCGLPPKSLPENPCPSGSSVNHQTVAAQLDEWMRGEAILQDQDVTLQQLLQLGVAHVPRRHEQ